MGMQYADDPAAEALPHDGAASSDTAEVRSAPGSTNPSPADFAEQLADLRADFDATFTAVSERFERQIAKQTDFTKGQLDRMAKQFNDAIGGNKQSLEEVRDLMESMVDGDTLSAVKEKAELRRLRERDLALKAAETAKEQEVAKPAAVAEAEGEPSDEDDTRAFRAKVLVEYTPILRAVKRSAEKQGVDLNEAIKSDLWPTKPPQDRNGRALTGAACESYWTKFHADADAAVDALADKTLAAEKASGPKTRVDTTLPQGGTGTAEDRYREALRTGKPLPSKAAIDAMTAKYLR